MTDVYTLTVVMDMMKGCMMDAKDITVFMNSLNLQLNMLNFDFMVTIPMSFSDLASGNRVSDKAFRSLNLPEQIRGKMLKELLKPIASHVTHSKCALGKRKQNSSSNLEPSAKRTSHQSDIKSHSCRADQLAEDQVLQQKEGEEKVSENEDQIDLEDEEVDDAIQHLNAFLEKENLERLRIVLNKSRDDGDLVIGLGIHLLSKLAGKAFISAEKSSRTCPCGCVEKIQGGENMWVGSQSTWYGELDILTGNPAVGNSVSVLFDRETTDCDTEVQAKSEQVTEQFEIEDEDKPEEGDVAESPGNKTNMDGFGIRPQLNQTIAQAIVFAFTEYNRHKTKGKCIPSILIDKSGFQYVIYNPVDDILLVSNYMMFANEDNFHPATGFRPFVVLWIILHHRIFFSRYPDFRRHCVKSGFHEKMTDLEQFQNLAGYSKRLDTEQTLIFLDDTPNTIGTEALSWFLNNKSSA